jgi:hypothetical protein
MDLLTDHDYLVEGRPLDKLEDSEAAQLFERLRYLGPTWYDPSAPGRTASMNEVFWSPAQRHLLIFAPGKFTATELRAA